MTPKKKPRPGRADEACNMRRNAIGFCRSRGCRSACNTSSTPGIKRGCTNSTALATKVYHPAQGAFLSPLLALCGRSQPLAEIGR